MAGPTEGVHVHNDDDVDGCTCDIAIRDDEITSDVNLPPATGGVQRAAETIGNEDNVDGCDLAFDSGVLTADQDLPAASGGVAPTP